MEEGRVGSLWIVTIKDRVSCWNETNFQEKLKESKNDVLQTTPASVQTISDSLWEEINQSHQGHQEENDMKQEGEKRALEWSQRITMLEGTKPGSWGEISRAYDIHENFSNLEGT